MRTIPRTAINLADRIEAIMKNCIAYCGLDCEACEARLATIHDNDELREKVARQWTETFSASITPEMINCTGCRIEGVKTPYCDTMCEIRRCGMNRGFETCADCGEMDACEKLKIVIEHCDDALHNLRHGK